ncbi:hypothetical protein A1O1_07293 [Capronia coronata CBS 617.96]|uniref:DUF4484 domain-containing protein n=1 Tax=Capronia coronata CBS 617.96 TaxID=1182541 RepID=W9YN27_9EURO|nr:uncharacterized protein A1O1_07293 [Capronia coronata CBS 617.96]EXJ83669.1 hypothetical protein A1O1_07293 [Capronia coronata CBS 617.96]
MADRSPLKIDISSEPPVPPIAAAFLVNFDHRKGYTLVWHRSIDEAQVEGVVEFKSLPSGLHNVEEDLVYFIHDKYSGLSAFINKPDGQSERAARMLAVGVLVPLEFGRTGRSWRHAEALQALARSQIDNVQDTTALEEYWGKYRLRPDERPEQEQVHSEYPGHSATRQPANGYRKSRSMSTATTFLPSHHTLTPHHPALTLLDSADIFGPLLFPLYRAALLRKRILIVADTPVQSSCNLVYNMSILSSVSKALLEFLPSGDTPSLWLRPLFTVGVGDIPELETTKSSPTSVSIAEDNWIACTTDDVLSTKPQLYDVLVLMPPSESNNAATKVFPKMVLSSPELTKSFPKVGIKSTQRDFQRFVRLQQGLLQFRPSKTAINGSLENGAEGRPPLSSRRSSFSANKAVVEPASWSRMAYTSLVWWASAGDRRGGLVETEEAENEQDLALLSYEDDSDSEQTREVALVAYFHRLTEIIFQTVAEAIARSDGTRSAPESSYHDDDNNDNTESIYEETVQRRASSEGEETQGLLADPADNGEVEITPEDMAAMGLDSWSASDRAFVEELVRLWWGRKAVVRPTSIECCGLRIY